MKVNDETIVQQHSNLAISKMHDAQKIAVTLVLGNNKAGKTSFVNHLVNEFKSKTIAVVQTSVGEIKVDAEWVDHHAIVPLNDSFLTSAANCACCDLGGSLYQSLKQIAQREQRVDWLVMEVSGKDTRIDSLICLFFEPGIANEYHIDAVLSIVDVEEWHNHRGVNGQRLQSNPMLMHGLVFSDRVVLNKMDRVEQFDDFDMESLVQEVRNINPCAGIVRAEKGSVDVHLVTQIETMSVQNPLYILKELDAYPLLTIEELFENAGEHGTNSTTPTPSRKPKRRKVDSISPETDKENGGETIRDKLSFRVHRFADLCYLGIESSCVFHRHRFEAFLEQLYENPPKPFRMKGILTLSKSLNIPSIIQSVNCRFVHHAVTSCESDGRSVMVMVGKDLDIDWIMKQLEGALYGGDEQEAEDEQFYYQED